MHISFDSRGREVLSDVPAQFVVPDQRRISTLDFHRQRLLEERENLRRMLAEMKESEEFETFAEANDFRVEDPFDDEAQFTDFELDDDSLDGLEAVAREEHRRTMAKVADANRQNITPSTETQSPPESES